jgi:hypothetical protein
MREILQHILCAGPNPPEGAAMAVVFGQARPTKACLVHGDRQAEFDQLVTFI